MLSVCKRDERIYEIELPDVDASAPPPEESILEPQYEEAPTAGVRTAFQPIPQAGSSLSTQKPSPITTALPFKLTEALLKQWKNPSDYWFRIIEAAKRYHFRCIEGQCFVPVSQWVKRARNDW